MLKYVCMYFIFTQNSSTRRYLIRKINSLGSRGAGIDRSRAMIPGMFHVASSGVSRAYNVCMCMFLEVLSSTAQTMRLCTPDPKPVFRSPWTLWSICTTLHHDLSTLSYGTQHTCDYYLSVDQSRMAHGRVHWCLPIYLYFPRLGARMSRVSCALLACATYKHTLHIPNEMCANMKKRNTAASHHVIQSDAGASHVRLNWTWCVCEMCMILCGSVSVLCTVEPQKQIEYKACPL